MCAFAKPTSELNSAQSGVEPIALTASQVATPWRIASTAAISRSTTSTDRPWPRLIVRPGLFHSHLASAGDIVEARALRLAAGAGLDHFQLIDGADEVRFACSGEQPSQSCGERGVERLGIGWILLADQTTSTKARVGDPIATNCER